MHLSLTTIKKEHKQALKQMLVHYFKEIAPSNIVQTDEGETIDYPYLDLYWIEPNRIPLYIVYDQKIAGFVLINDWVVWKAFGATHSIAEFYIKPAFRRKGIGQHVAHTLFNQHKGKWEVKQSATNLPAVAFWRKTIAEFTKGDFEEKTMEMDGEINFFQLFESS